MIEKKKKSRPPYGEISSHVEFGIDQDVQKGKKVKKFAE